MGAVFELMGSTALLLRGTEGEVVADARRLPQMDGFIAGRRVALLAHPASVTEDLTHSLDALVASLRAK